MDIFPHGATSPSGSGPLYCRGFTITLRDTTLDMSPVDKQSAQRTDLYLSTHNTHKEKASILPAGSETIIPESERPQTHAFDRVLTGIGSSGHCEHLFP